MLLRNNINNQFSLSITYQNEIAELKEELQEKDSIIGSLREDILILNENKTYIKSILNSGTHSAYKVITC